MNSRFTHDFKKAIVEKITVPGGVSVSAMSKELGLPYMTVYGWVRYHANISSMKKRIDWTPERKLEAIIETAKMSEIDLGIYLRSKGLHSQDLEQWRQDFYEAQRHTGRPRQNPEVAALKNREKELEKDLQRKDKALAEMSARIVLLKKSRLIWGDGEDVE